MELAVGITVKIKRSDGMYVLRYQESVTLFSFQGRVHDAVVSGIDTGKSLVSVEWHERDETKGKEVSGRV